jgi:CRP-like cAMP-binding protein
VVSVGDSLLLVAGRKLLLKEFEDNTALLRFLVGELSHKLYTLGQASAMNVLYPVENRFASYLMSLFSGQYRCEAGRRDPHLQPDRDSRSAGYKLQASEPGGAPPD